MQRKSGPFPWLLQFSQLPPRWLKRLSEKGTGLLKSCGQRLFSRRMQESCPLFGQSLGWSRVFLAAALPKKRCLELCIVTKCWSFERLKVPDTFFWAKLLAAGFFGLLGGGCGSRPTTVSSAAKPHEGKLITVSCPGKPATEVVERYSSSWSLQSGARVAVVNYDAQTGPEAGPRADLWVVAPADIGAVACEGAVVCGLVDALPEVAEVCAKAAPAMPAARARASVAVGESFMGISAMRHDNAVSSPQRPLRPDVPDTAVG